MNLKVEEEYVVERSLSTLVHEAVRASFYSNVVECLISAQVAWV